MQTRYAVIVCCVAILCLLIAWKKRQNIMRLIAALLISVGLLIAYFFGTAVALKLPGIGPVVVGGAASAAMGAGVWYVVGNIGIVAMGTGIGVGIWPLLLAFAAIGSLGAFAGSIGLRTVHYPLLYLPLLVAGTVLLFRSLKKKPPANQHGPDESPPNQR